MLDIYGSFTLGTNQVHYITFVCLVALALYYLNRLRNVEIPLLMKLLLPGLYVFGAVMHYEIFWNIVWMGYHSFAILDFTGFLLSEILIIHTINYVFVSTFKYEIPKISLTRHLILSYIIASMIWWLNTTGFYVGWDLFYDGLTTVDPHNFAWAVGKIVSLLGWIMVTNND